MRSRLEVIGEEDAAPVTVPAPPPEAPRTIRYVDVSELTGLLVRGLSERTSAVLSAFVNLALLASVFVLLMQIINLPSPLQLMAVGGYALFVLTTLWIRR